MNHNEELLTFKTIAEATSSVVGKDFLKELVRSLAQVIDVYGAWITEISEDRANFYVRAMWLDGKFLDEFVHVIKGTPCEKVIANPSGIYHIPDRIIQLFPENEHLKRHGAVSYMGIAIRDVDGKIVGNLAVLNNKPMPHQPRIENIFRIFAARATAEMQRLFIEKQLEESEQRLKRLVNGTHDAIIELNERLQVTQMNDAAKKMFRVTEPVTIHSLKTFLKLEGLQKLTNAIVHLKSRSLNEPYFWFPEYIECQSIDDVPFPAEATITHYQHLDQSHFILVLRNVRNKLEAEEKIKSLSIETQFLREEIKTIYNFQEIIGSSPAILKAMNAVRLVGPTDATVLLTGETGTGKELFARAIHNSSSRKHRPMVTVNCGALPANLIESELFGHEKGAFTGANNKREGRFAAADNGIIFLDEIGEFPLELQPKLLRVLQEGEFQPVGSNTTIKVNVRVIAATNRNLLDEVRRGRFREDLYYRLNVYPIQIPPLRERGDDVILLAEKFLHHFAKNMHKTIPPLTEKDKQRILSYPWPGNVRELRNLMERIVITNEGGTLDVKVDSAANPKRLGNICPTTKIFTHAELRELEKDNILLALKHSNGRISGPDGAAALLGLPASTLSSRMKALDITKLYEIPLTKIREYT